MTPSACPTIPLALLLATSALQAGAMETNDTAASGPPELQEIIVSARKRDERLIDIAESITVISGEDLTKNGITSVEDVGRQTPNLQLNMRQDLTTDVVIRGVGAYGDVLGVGFNIDGVPNFTDQTMRLEDLESVEILKGPQGTLYGGSSIGGLVRYVSKRPDFNWQGESSVEVGQYSTTNVSAAQNIPIIDGILAARVSGYDVKSDGYITNSDLGINGDPLTDYGMRMAFLYKPTDTIDALLTLRYSFIENGSDEYIPVPGVRDYSYDAPFYQPTFNIRKTYGVVLDVNDDLGFAKLTSISSFTTAHNQWDADVSQSPSGLPGLTYYTLPGNRPTEVSTQELRLTSPSNGHFEWLAGLYAASIKDVLLNQVAQYFVPPPADNQTINDFDTTRVDTAAFGTLSYFWGPLRLDAGLRINRTVYNARVYVEAGGPPDQTNEITSRGTLPKLSLSYAFAPDKQVYATFAKGEEPGAVNTVSTYPIPYRSETAQSYEVGTKGETSDHRFEYSLSAFYVKDQNHQYESNLYNASLGGFLSLITNIGSSRTFGVESELNWQATNEWRFGLTGGYLEASWLNASYFGAPVNGNIIPNAPRVSTNVSTAYSRPVANNLRIDANFNVGYTDSMWWDVPNTPGTKEPPHFMSNARIALGSDQRGWQIAVRVANLFNQKYWTEYYPQFFAPGTYPCNNCTDMGFPGAPREVFGSVSYKY
jgi:iron complex outermembrane receptor protein